ncbi:MAG: sodium:proton antiporter [Pseudomonadota bacterium]
MTVGLLVVMLVTAVFALVAKRLSTTVITAPMVFLALGYLASLTGLLPHEEIVHALHLVAEIALVVLLFLDAAQMDVMAFRKRHVWPVRMLAIGLPLTIALGTLAAFPFLDGWPLVGVALVAAILAPTDAALGQAVVTNPLVPERVRRALTVESGLNDGLALPAVLLFASLAAEAMDSEQTSWLVFAAKQLILGPVAGLVIGLTGAKLLLLAKDRNLTSTIYEGIAALALAFACYLAANAIGGNGFIAAFTGGLTFGAIVQGRCKFVYEFTESEGQMLAWAAFFLLGLALVPDAIQQLTWSSLAIILISLFIVRPLAIWLSLIGTDAAPVTRLFFGWFGPRGLATALFALLILEQITDALSAPVLALAINAVWISALLHGLSAMPAAKRYAKVIAAMGPCAETQAMDKSDSPLAPRDP